MVELVRKWDSIYISEKDLGFTYILKDFQPVLLGDKKGRESRSRRELAKDIHRNENELYRQSISGYSQEQKS